MKLKFLTLLSKEEVDYASILRGVLNISKVRWYHTLYFIKTFKKLIVEIEEIRKLDPKKVEESSDCEIKRPESIDLIAYGAMIELQQLFQNPGSKEIGDLIIETIALSCFESHTKKPFDSDSEEYRTFKNEVAESDLVHMLGLYTWIDREADTSLEKWNSLFLEVKVEDPDWDNAGGGMMDKFHILTTIKRICLDFNVDYYNALKFPYALVQANSLSSSTKVLIQERLKEIIKAKMIIERDKKN